MGTSDKVKGAFTVAHDEAVRLGRDCVSVELIVLGIIDADPDGLAAQALQAEGIELAELRRQIIGPDEPRAQAERIDELATEPDEPQAQAERIVGPDELRARMERLEQILGPDEPRARAIELAELRRQILGPDEPRAKRLTFGGGPHVPFCAETREAVSLAEPERQALRHDQIEPVAILLALIKGAESSLTQLLAPFGVHPRQLRLRVIRLAGD